MTQLLVKPGIYTIQTQAHHINTTIREKAAQLNCIAILGRSKYP